MNVNKNIKNLLYALKQKEKFYKINSFKFYSEKNNKLMKYLAEEYRKGSEADGK